MKCEIHGFDGFGVVFPSTLSAPIDTQFLVYSTPGPFCFLYLPDVWCFYQQVPMQTAFSSKSPHPSQSTCQLAISCILGALVCINKLCIASPLPGSNNWLGQYHDRFRCSDCKG